MGKRIPNLETKWFDVKKELFENETEAILYVIKDKEESDDYFIFSLPMYCFSYTIYSQKDFDWHLENNIPVGDPVRKKKFIEIMKRIIEEWDNS